MTCSKELAYGFALAYLKAIEQGQEYVDKKPCQDYEE